MLALVGNTGLNVRPHAPHLAEATPIAAAEPAVAGSDEQAGIHPQGQTRPVTSRDGPCRCSGHPAGTHRPLESCPMDHQNHARQEFALMPLAIRRLSPSTVTYTRAGRLRRLKGNLDPHLDRLSRCRSTHVENDLRASVK
jgi:hypothetical protein